MTLMSPNTQPASVTDSSLMSVDNAGRIITNTATKTTAKIGSILDLHIFGMGTHGKRLVKALINSNVFTVGDFMVLSTDQMFNLSPQIGHKTVDFGERVQYYLRTGRDLIPGRKKPKGYRIMYEKKLVPRAKAAMVKAGMDALSSKRDQVIRDNEAVKMRMDLSNARATNTILRLKLRHQEELNKQLERLLREANRGIILS